ncbi:MAG: phage/plasmid replication protein, II/X family [Thermoplasmatales archaeon]
MIDTIRIVSPYLTEQVADRIEKVARIRMGIDLELDAVLYTITTKELKGSWDSSISVQVKREKFRTDDRGIPYLSECEPYVIIEASIHKLVFGHNCFLGWDNFQESAKYLVEFTSKALEVKLPDYTRFEVHRIDVSENYDLGSKEAVYEWFRIMKLKKYPRRKPNTYYDNGLYFPGTSTTWKAYAKGDDFKKHDHKRIRLNKSKDIADKILKISYNIIRFEIEIRLKKLRYDLDKKIIYVTDIEDDYLKELFEKENMKIIREGEDVKIVNQTYDVKNRLIASVSNRKARTLLGTWMQFSTLGEEMTKETMCKATYYKHRKQLVDLGISWVGTDISINETNVLPIDFQPTINSKYRLTYEKGLVLQKLVG